MPGLVAGWSGRGRALSLERRLPPAANLVPANGTGAGQEGIRWGWVGARPPPRRRARPRHGWPDATTMPRLYQQAIDLAEEATLGEPHLARRAPERARHRLRVHRAVRRGGVALPAGSRHLRPSTARTPISRRSTTTTSAGSSRGDFEGGGAAAGAPSRSASAAPRRATSNWLPTGGPGPILDALGKDGEAGGPLPRRDRRLRAGARPG